MVGLERAGCEGTDGQLRRLFLSPDRWERQEGKQDSVREGEVMKRLLTALAVVATLAAADTLSVPLGRIACIRNGDYARLLARFDLSAMPESSHIYYAQIVAPCEVAETIAIETRRVTTPWSHDNVRWDYPWRKQGGDFDTTRSVVFTYLAGRHKQLSIDVTHYVRNWLSHGYSGNNGLLFRNAISREPGFGQFQGLSQVLEKARIRVIFRKPYKHDVQGTEKPSSD